MRKQWAWLAETGIPPGVAAQVDREVADAVSERVRQWDADGLALEDQLMASYGPAMEVYGRHGRVLNPAGTDADLDRYPSPRVLSVTRCASTSCPWRRSTR